MCDFKQGERNSHLFVLHILPPARWVGEIRSGCIFIQDERQYPGGGNIIGRERLDKPFVHSAYILRSPCGMERRSFLIFCLHPE